MSKIFALEYFGHNCQNYMNHRDFLFDDINQVGLYIKIPIYNSTIENKSLEWFEILKNFDNQINLSKNFSLFDFAIN